MINFKQIKMVLFDLDGTLVDSVPDLSWCGDEMMRRLKLSPRGMGSARCWVGNGIERFVKRVLTNDMSADPDVEQYRQAIEIFKNLYAEHTCDLSQLYPGVTEGLDQLAEMNLSIACVTNKAELFTLKLLETIGLKKHFKLVVSGDTTNRKKPDPLPLFYASDYYQLNPADCLMIGDSENDVKAARAAGFAIICVPYGYNHGVDIREAKPDLIINSINELPELLHCSKSNVSSTTL
jgi:phosphoglycolate phosphatase